MLLHWTLSSQFWTFFAITKTKHVFFFLHKLASDVCRSIYRLSMGKNCIYEADNRYNTVKAINAGCNELNLKQSKRDI